MAWAPALNALGETVFRQDELAPASDKVLYWTNGNDKYATPFIQAEFYATEIADKTPGILFRLQGGNLNDGGYLVGINPSSSEIKLFRKNAVSITATITYTLLKNVALGFTVETGRRYLITIHADTTRIRVWVDGKLFIDQAESTYTDAGFVGLLGQSGCEIDNLFTAELKYAIVPEAVVNPIYPADEVLLTYQPIQDSIIVNGGFESGTTSWIAGSTTTISEETSITRAGSKSLKMVGYGTLAESAAAFTINGLKTYVFQGDFRLDAGSLDIVFQFAKLDDGTAFTGNEVTIKTVSASAGRWQHVYAVLSLTGEAGRIQLKIAGSTDRTVYADNISMQEVLPVLLFTKTRDIDSYEPVTAPVFITTGDLEKIARTRVNAALAGQLNMNPTALTCNVATIIGNIEIPMPTIPANVAAAMANVDMVGKVLLSGTAAISVLEPDYEPVTNSVALSVNISIPLSLLTAQMALSFPSLEMVGGNAARGAASISALIVAYTPATCNISQRGVLAPTISTGNARGTVDDVFQLETHVTERLSEYTDNTEIDGAADGAVSTVTVDDDFSAGKLVSLNSAVEALVPKSVYAWFRTNQGDPTDDTLYFRYKIPYTNYCKTTAGVNIGEFSDADTGNDTAVGWTNGNTLRYTIVTDAYLSGKALEANVMDGTQGILFTMTDTFTTPSNVTNGKLKMRVLKVADVPPAGATILSFWARIIDGSNNTVQTHVIYTASNGSASTNLGGATWTEEAAEVVFDISGLSANTAYKLRFVLNGGGLGSSITRRIDNVRIEFPNGETTIIEEEINNKFSRKWDYVILDVRDTDTSNTGGALAYRYYNIAEIHDSTSDNNVTDENWSGNNDSVPTGWTENVVGGSASARIIGGTNGDLRLSASESGGIIGEVRLDKDVGYFVTGGMTYELNYKVTTDTDSDAIYLRLFDGVKSLIINITPTGIKYTNTLGNSVSTGVSGFLIGTEYILRILWESSTSSLLCYIREAGSTTWTMGDLNTNAGQTDVTASGTVRLGALTLSPPGAQLIAESKYFSAARGLIKPLDALPKWDQLKRIRLSPYWQVLAPPDATTFTIDAMGVRVIYPKM